MSVDNVTTNNGFAKGTMLIIRGEAMMLDFNDS